MKNTFTVKLNKYNDYSNERLNSYFENNSERSFEIIFERFNDETRKLCFYIVEDIIYSDENAQIKIKIQEAITTDQSKIEFISKLKKYINIDNLELHRGTINYQILKAISQNNNLTTLSLNEVHTNKEFDQKKAIEILSDSNIKNLTYIIKNKYDIIPFKIDDDISIILQNSQIKNFTTVLDNKLAEMDLPKKICFNILQLQYSKKIINYNLNNQLINNSNEIIKKSLKRKREEEEEEEDLETILYIESQIKIEKEKKQNIDINIFLITDPDQYSKEIFFTSTEQTEVANEEITPYICLTDSYLKLALGDWTNKINEEQKNIGHSPNLF
jgi:hypothetical protein